jgi:ubiquitin-protein ligase
MMVREQIRFDAIFLGSSGDSPPVPLVAAARLTGSALFIPETTSDIDHVFQDEAFFNPELREYDELRSPRPEDMIPDRCVRSKPFSVEWLQEPLADPYWILERSQNNQPTTMRDRYLVDDLFQIAKRADPTWQVYVNQNRMWEWRILLSVEEGSYAGFWFHLVLKFGLEYPYNGPEIRFIGAPYHVNISNHGRIFPEIEYVNDDRALGLVSKIKTFLVTAPVNPDAVDEEHAAVFKDQAQYAEKIREANERNGKRAPKDFTRRWNIRMGKRNTRLRRPDLNF